MPRRARRRPGGPVEARSRLEAAHEFLASAENAVTHAWWRTVVAQAAEAAIAAGDVIGYAAIGERSASADHQTALDVLEESGASTETLDDLRWLLAQKSPAQYIEDWPGDRTTADDAVARAQRIVDTANRAFAKAESSAWPRPAPTESPLAAAVRRTPRRRSPSDKRSPESDPAPAKQPGA